MSNACRLIPIIALALAACANAATGQPQPEPASVPEPGMSRVGLLGDFAGRQLRITVDDQVLVDGRLNFPPPGAETRFEAGIGLERVSPVQVAIEGCDETWSGQILLVPRRTSHLLIEGCSVRSFRPE